VKNYQLYECTKEKNKETKKKERKKEKRKKEKKINDSPSASQSLHVQK
jgi:hypothetical protein